MIGVVVTLCGIILDGFTVRNYGDKRNLLSFFVIAVGCSIVVQVISPNIISLHSKVLGAVLLTAGLILRFSNGKASWLDYQSNESSEDTFVMRWTRFSSRGLVFSILFTGVLLLADLSNLIPNIQ